MGVGYEFDARGVLAPDLDLDGRRDLLVVRNDWIRGAGGVVPKQSLYCLRNELETGNHWIGVRLLAARPGVSPIGAKVILMAAGAKRERRVVTGDSYYGQSPAVAHFGLGETDRVAAIEVIWPDGTRTRIENPAVDRYHIVAPPAE